MLPPPPPPEPMRIYSFICQLARSLSAGYGVERGKEKREREKERACVKMREVHASEKNRAGEKPCLFQL